MLILDKLASSLQRRDEIPNRKLAHEIAEANDANAVSDLTANLKNKDRNIQSDIIKVLCEIGASKPQLIAGHFSQILSMLGSSNNRLQWGAMTALNYMTDVIPGEIYHSLPEILAVAAKGSVITNDQCVNILVKLCSVKEYSDDAFLLLNERLSLCSANQLPMYAENAMTVIQGEQQAILINTLQSRLKDVGKEARRRRILQVIKKLRKG